ncbi:hypothetical protein EMIHUDRAFT_364279, partial [Emiliania huxleyi CCMP1516]|uniref:2-dehydropantoate 2-reductase n=2 Tax=Emiliania huxleyi TaxID=2903 RepID=A0A0D3KAA8_EMIH1
MHILGGGALGTLWAAHCPAATLLLREGTTALQASRLRLRVHRLRAGEAAGPVDEALEACVRLEPSSGSATTPIGTLVIATKAYGAAAALEGVRSRLQSDAVVVLLCNGALSLADSLQLPAGGALLVATTTHGAWLHPPRQEGLREVQHAGRGTTWVGPLLPLRAGGGGGGGGGGGAARVAGVPEVTSSSSAELAAARFAAAGLGAVVEGGGQTSRRLWEKPSPTPVLNPLTALWNVRNGEVLRRPDGRRIAADVCAEIAQVCAAAPPAAATPSPSARELEAFVEDCASENAGNWSSMHQDLHHGRRTEVEHLNGWVARRARELGTRAEANDALAEQMRRAEAAKGQTGGGGEWRVERT